ncbi:MAG: NUDIX hydrolase [Candidatus Xenobia bacterium]
MIVHRQVLPSNGLTPAAVLVPMYEKDGRTWLLFTQRTETVKDHKGQICFPGGACDAVDCDIVATALRESQEEIGLLPAHVEVVGMLDDMVTHTGYHITPILGRIPYPYSFSAREAEVAAILEVPLDDLLRGPEVRPRTIAGVTYDVYYYQSGPHTIWGITGRIVKNLLEVLQG